MHRYWRTALCVIAAALANTASAQQMMVTPAPIVASAARPLSGWYVQTDGIYLHRSIGSSAVLLTNPAGTTALATADQIAPDWGAGPRVAIGRQLNACNDFEVLYFGLYDMQGIRSVPGPGKVVGSPLVGTSFKIDYTSSMQNVEANLRQWLNGELSLLAGFRYINWHEELHNAYATGAVIAAPGPTATSTLITNNNLYGFQAGAQWQKSCNRCGIDAYGKAGIFGNEAYTRGSATPFPPVSTGTCQAAFVGEVGLIGSYRVTDCMAVRAGYTVMWLEGLALAPNQPAGVNFANGTASAHTTGGVFLHGVIAGLEFRW